MAAINLPKADTVLAGPFWNGPVRVLAASINGRSVRLKVVGVSDSAYSDRTLTMEQFETLVREVVGGTYTFDAEPRLFRLATEALRTHLAHSFDPQFAVSVSQVDPLPHQLDAVYKHMLPLPRIRFLLADDPGAGKTIMAGLLMRELMQRQDVHRVLVLCPKALTDQWRREMWERFRERFVLVTGDVVAGAFGSNVWLENDHVVASVDLGVQEHILPGLEQAQWDLIIFDEAHKLSAYRYGPRSKIDKTKRYQLAEKLSKKTKHMLLMTATPHRGDDENFRLLMSLLDDKVFASQAGLRSALDKDSSPYFLRRMKESMRHFDGRPIFLPRHVDTMKYDLEPHEQALYDAVTDYVAHGLEQAESAKNRNVGLALTILQRRLASSLHAITRSLERRRDRLSEALDEARKTGKVRQQAQEGVVDDDHDDDDTDIDEQEEQVSGASNARTSGELQAEIVLLEGLIDQARTAIRQGPERKLREFRTVVENETVSHRNEKFLVFTEHKDTLDYLTRKLKEWGYSVCNIHGGMKLQDRIAPCLILIDELVSYLVKLKFSNTKRTQNLYQQTVQFLQETLQEAGNTKAVCVLMSLPKSRTEFGGIDPEKLQRELGVLDELKPKADRVVSKRTPVNDEEIYTLMSKRLFQRADREAASFAARCTARRMSARKGSMIPRSCRRITCSSRSRPIRCTRN